MSAYHYSIIIPHKDRPTLLARLLESIPSRDDIEVIVVDDASENQETLATALVNFSSRFGKLHVLPNPTKNSLGAGWARNQGLGIAKGEYLLFADSDDSFTFDAFDHFDHIRLTRSEVELCVFKSDSVRLDGLRSHRTDFTNYLIELASLIVQAEGASNLLRQVISKIDPPWAKLIKKSLIDECNITFEEIMVSDDILFNLDVIACAKEIGINLQPVYRVLDHTNTLGNKRTKESLRVRLQASVRFITELSKLPFAPKKPISVSGGHVWNSIVYGGINLYENLKYVLKHNAPLIYPWYRYIYALYFALIGYDTSKIRAFIIFGHSIMKYHTKMIINFSK